MASQPSDERHTLTLRNLKKFTKYSVEIQAYNKIGAGPRNSEIIESTAEDGECKDMKMCAWDEKQFVLKKFIVTSCKYWQYWGILTSTFFNEQRINEEI